MLNILKFDLFILYGVLYCVDLELVAFHKSHMPYIVDLLCIFQLIHGP